MITIEASDKSGFFKIDGLDYQKNQYVLRYDNETEAAEDINFSLCGIADGKKIIASRGFAEITGVTSWAELLTLLASVEALSNNDVSIQDQHTPIVIATMSSEEASTISATLTAIDDYSFDVADSTGFIIGHYLSIFNIAANRFFLANILNVVSNTITVDTPLDFAYPVGSFVTSGTKSMNVDGSVTPVVFGLRNTEEAIGSAFDITRIMFACATLTAVDLSKFGDIAGGITKGIVFRKKDGEYRNIFNVKKNGEMARLMYDWTPFAATNPQQGQDGFVGRLTFAGANKIGVSIRLEPGEDIQMIIQDDLSSLINFEIIAEGHTVET